MRRVLLAAIPLLVLAQGCATADARDDGLTGGGTTVAKAEREARRYEADATVLQNPEHGPELCLGAVTSSLPPRCGGVPIPNWRWDQVTGDETRAGTTWGNFHVVGTYDGATFTVHEATAPRPPSTTQDEPFKTTCPEPKGGWPPQVNDPTGAKLDAVSRLARSAPDFAGFWITYLSPMGNNVAEDPGDLALNAAFTGDLKRHEAELRKHWSGPLCVTRHARPYRDLQRIQGELGGAVGKSLGLEVLRTNVSEIDNVVELGVVVLDERARAAVEQRYGPGTVRIEAALQPVERAAR
jgi:hypothetical protein